jgi:uncharacterized iron-regulated membrane protein
MNRVLRSAHRYVGIVFAAIWLMQGLTGALLVFHWDLDDWSVAGPAEPLDVPALSQALGGYAARYPGHTVAAVYASGGERGRFDVLLNRPSGRNDVLRVDGRGTVLRLRPGNYDWLRIGPFQIATYLHQTLFAGIAGQWFLGASGFVLLLNLAVGLKLAWPRGSWRQALCPADAMRTPTGRLWGLHRALGLWFALPAMLIVALGVCLAFRGPLATMIGDPAPQPQLAAAAAIPARAPPITATEAIDTAFGRYPASALAALILPTARSPWYEVQVQQPGEWRRTDGLTTVDVSSRDGRVLAVYDAERGPLPKRMLDSLYALHTGFAGGVLLRWLAVLMSVWLVVMISLGLMLWSTRRAARKRPSKASRTAAPT